MFYLVCLFLAISTNLFSMKIEKKYEINKPITNSYFNDTRDSIVIESIDSIYYVNFKENKLDNSEKLINVDSVIFSFNPNLLTNKRVVSSDRKYIVVVNKNEAYKFSLIDVSENKLYEYGLLTEGDQGICFVSSYGNYYFKDDKLIAKYGLTSKKMSYSCRDIYKSLTLKTKEISDYDPPISDNFHFKSLSNSFNKSYIGITNSHGYSREGNPPDGPHESYDVTQMDVVEPINNKIINSFYFKQTTYYNSGKYLYTDPQEFRTIKNGYMGFKDSTCFIDINDSLYYVNYYKKEFQLYKNPKFNFNRKINYFAGYEDKSVIIFGTIIIDSLEKYVVCEFDLKNGKLLDSLHLFSSELTNKKNISIIGYNHELNLVIVNYSDGIVYEIDNVKSKHENEKYAKLIIKNNNLRLGEKLEYTLETTNFVHDFETQVLDKNNEVLYQSTNLKDSVLISNSGDYRLIAKYKNQKNDEIQIVKYFSIRAKLICNFDITNNVQSIPFEFNIIDKCEGDIIEKKYTLLGKELRQEEINNNIIINRLGKSPLTLTVSDGIETLSLTKYVFAIEPKLSNVDLIESNISLLFAPYRTSLVNSYGNNYFKLSNKEYKEIKVIGNYYIPGAGFFHLSRIEHNDTSLTLMNNIIQDNLYREKLFQTNWSKDTLIGITRNKNNVSYENKIFINRYFNDTLRNSKEINLDKPYQLLGHSFSKNKLMFILYANNQHYLLFLDDKFDMIALDSLSLNNYLNENYNIGNNHYLIKEEDNGNYNFVMLKNKELAYKLLKVSNNKILQIRSFTYELNELVTSNYKFLGIMNNNIPFVMNKSDNKHYIYKFKDSINVEKIEIPLKSRNEANLNSIVINDNILFINSDTLDNTNYLYFDNFNFNKNTMYSYEVKDRLVKIRNINKDGDSLFLSGNLYNSINNSSLYYAKIALSKLGITSSIDNPDEPSDLIFDRKANSSINELNLEFVYTSDNIITITNENEKFTGDISIYDNSGVEVTNLGKLDFIKGENSIDLNNNGLNYKVFFMKIHYEGKNSIYKFIYIK